MRQVFYEVAEAILQGKKFALGQVIDTSGSTPQKPGAKAIFLPDGQSSGTLGGGCLEAEAKRVALECLRQRSRTLLTLHLDSDFGFDDGLICGGTARIFLDGKPDEQTDLWQAVANFLKTRRRGALLTVVDASDVNLVGIRWLIEAKVNDATLLSVISSGRSAPPPPKEALQLARKVINQNDEAVAKAMLETVQVELFAEPLLPRPHLIIAGAGHIGVALAHLGALLDFEVTVIDDRPSFANRQRLPDADHIIVGDIPKTISDQPMDKDTYIVIVTRGHRHDSHVLRQIIQHVNQLNYIGMIGSRRKIKLIYDELLDEGLATPEQLVKIHSPIGLDIGGETVWEIAISIFAELVWLRNKCQGNFRPLYEKMLPLLQTQKQTL